MSYFEEAKEEFGNFKPVERYAYASTSRVNQGARYGDSIILDQFADQMQMNRNPTILQSLAEEIATMKLANKVMQNRGGGTLVCGSPNEVAPDPTLDDYFGTLHWKRYHVHLQTKVSRCSHLPLYLRTRRCNSP